MNILKDEGLIQSVTLLVWSRLRKFNSEMELDDLLQEARIVYIKCTNSYDGKNSAMFSTYVTTSIRNRLNYIVDCEIQRLKHELSNDPEDSDILNYEPSADPTPEAVAEQMNAYEVARAKLTPIARVMLDAVLNPTVKISDEIEALKAHYRLSNKRGCRFIELKAVELLMIKMGISKREIVKGKKQLLSI